MDVRVLGCSGGIGDGRHTTSFLIDHDILLDAGTGVTLLSRQELLGIDHLFLTHSHLDHILALPLLLDSVAGERGHPLVLHAIPEVLEILKGHLFNWLIWPDFSRVPTVRAPFMRYAPIEVDVPVRLGTREITAIPAHHVVPAVGYRLRGPSGSLVFSGDTASHAELWTHANETKDLRHLIVECSFPKAMAEVAVASKHYSPATLVPDLKQLEGDAQVWITHLKPGGETQIMAELESLIPGRVRALEEGMVFTL